MAFLNLQDADPSIEVQIPPTRFLPRWPYPGAEHEWIDATQALDRAFAGDARIAAENHIFAESLRERPARSFEATFLALANRSVARPRIEVAWEEDTLGYRVLATVYRGAVTGKCSETGLLQTTDFKTVRFKEQYKVDPPETVVLAHIRQQNHERRCDGSWAGIFDCCAFPKYDIRDAERTDAAVGLGIMRRGVLCHWWKALLHGLSKEFEVALWFSPVFFGPEFHFTWRIGIPVPEYTVEVERRPEDTLIVASLEPELWPLLAAKQIDRDEFDEFASDYLFTSVPRHLQAKALRQYLELDEGQAISLDVMQRLRCRRDPAIQAQAMWARILADPAEVWSDYRRMRGEDWPGRWFEALGGVLLKRPVDLALLLLCNCGEFFDQAILPWYPLSELLETPTLETLTSQQVARVDAALTRRCQRYDMPPTRVTKQQLDFFAYDVCSFNKFKELRAWASSHRTPMLARFLRELQACARGDAAGTPRNRRA